MSDPYAHPEQAFQRDTELLINSTVPSILERQECFRIVTGIRALTMYKEDDWEDPEADGA